MGKEKNMQKSSGELSDVVLCFVTEICCVAQAGLVFSILPCQPPECWAHRCAPLKPAEQNSVF